MDVVNSCFDFWKCPTEVGVDYPIDEGKERYYLLHGDFFVTGWLSLTFSPSLFLKALSPVINGFLREVFRGALDVCVGSLSAFLEPGSVVVSFPCRVESFLWEILVHSKRHGSSHEESSDVGPEGDSGRCGFGCEVEL